MNQQIDAHVYDRAAIAGADDAPGRILGQIRPLARVLDVGTGSGALGRSLTVDKQCIVDGLTCCAAELAAAQQHYRRILLVDLERQSASQAFAGEAYDYIVCADVLEHLRNADAVLADLCLLLAPGGRILVSVPNVTYLGVIASLVAGHLSRTREGLLDVTHVRFFDRRGLDELAAAAGMRVHSVERVIRNPGETEFRHLDFAAFPAAVAEYLRMLPDALTYEYVVELTRAGESGVASPVADFPAFADVDAVPYFEAQAFFDHGAGFSERSSVRAFGRLGEGRIELRFPVPDKISGALCGLLIDFADRPGTFELFGARLEDAGGQTLWHWAGDWGSGLIFRDLESLPARGLHGGRLMRGTSRQPRMQIGFAPPLPVEMLIVEMTAPQLHEALAFEQAQRSIVETIHLMRESIEIGSSVARTADEGIRSVQHQLEATNASICTIQHQLEAANDEIRALHRRLHSSSEENLSLHRLLQCAADEKLALIEARKAVETQVEECQRVQQRQQERILQLESRIASPFRLAAARLRWLARRFLRDDES